MVTTTTAPIDLTEATARDYLVARDLLAPDATAEVSVLGGGVSNQVVKVVSGEQRFVLKQSLSALRVAATWLADRRRILNEATAMQHLANILPEGTLPAVCDIDADNFILTMTCAPDEAVNWKSELLGGQVDLGAVEQCGEILAAMHERTQGPRSLASRFANEKIFRELRVDPYHKATATVHPDVAAHILAVAHRTLSTRTALVHGDFSPKNVLILPPTTPDQPRQVMLLDFEVVHFGDPSFDVGFMLNHLILKGLCQLSRSETFFGAARLFWHTYQSSRWPVAPDLERQSIDQLGCLMLARIDGKSPIEYVPNLATKVLIRHVAKRILLEQPPTLDAVVELLLGSFPHPNRRRAAPISRETVR